MHVVLFSYTLFGQLYVSLKTICACAKSHRLRAIFLPKVFPSQAGNGLHLHFSFRHGVSSQNAFIDRSRHYGISQLGESFMVRSLLHEINIAFSLAY
jgi:glutamine synthetase